MAVTPGTIKGNDVGVFIDSEVSDSEESILENWDTFVPFLTHPSEGASALFTWIPVAYSSNATISINTETRKYIQPVVKADRTENKRTGVTSATIQVDGLVALDHTNHDLEQLVGYLTDKQDLTVAWTSNGRDDYAMVAKAKLLSLQANAPVNGFVDYTATFDVQGDVLEMAT
jgi:hypothetical protein